jgi:hypothetical protein
VVELAGGAKLLQPHDAALPGRHTVRVRGELNRRLGQGGGTRARATRTRLRDRQLKLLSQPLIRLVGTAGQVPGRFNRVIQRSADEPVQTAAAGAGQHAFGRTAPVFREIHTRVIRTLNSNHQRYCGDSKKKIVNPGLRKLPYCPLLRRQP